MCPAEILREENGEEEAWEAPLPGGFEAGARAPRRQLTQWGVAAASVT